MAKEREYLILLEILMKSVEANKGLPAGTDDRLLDAEGLALKFFGHSSSAIYLYMGTTIPEINISYTDAASINVLGRSALETFLVFHHVFVDPKTEEEKDFKYHSWLLAGLLDRQKYPVQSPKGKMILLNEKNRIKSLRANLTKNPCFRALSSYQQTDLIRKGMWRFQSWNDIALAAGLNETHAKAFYNYLCGYAHAGNLSVSQLRQALSIDSQRTLSSAAIHVLMITIATMIKSYCTVFPMSESVLQRDEEASALIDMWIGVGSSSMEDIGID